MQLLADAAKAGTEEERLYSEHFACCDCGLSFGELAPRNFSFNSPHGACPDCTGLGVKMEIDPELVIPNKNLSLAEGAIAALGAHRTASHLVHAHAGGAGAQARLLTQHAGEGDDAGAAELVLYGDKDEITHQLHGLRRPREQLGHEVRGRDHQPRAPLQGDRLRLHARRVREVHGGDARARPAAAPASSRNRSR